MAADDAGVRGDRDQLPRSPGTAGRRGGHPERHSAHQHPVRRPELHVPAGVRAHVCRRWRTDRLAWNTSRLPADHDLLVARLCEPQPGDGILDARSQPVPPRRWRGRRLPRRDQGHRRMVSCDGTLHRDGRRQRGHGSRRGRRAAGDRRDRPVRQLAPHLRFFRRRRFGVGRVVDTRISPHRAAGCGRFDQARRLAGLTQDASRVGTGPGEVPHGRRVVLLHFLAAEVPV